MDFSLYKANVCNLEMVWHEAYLNEEEETILKFLFLYYSVVTLSSIRLHIVFYSYLNVNEQHKASAIMLSIYCRSVSLRTVY